MFDVGTYTMRNGEAAQVAYRRPADGQDEPCDYPLGGYYWNDGIEQWEHGCWDDKGYFITGRASENDLMPPRREYWVNEYAFERQCFGSQEGAETYRLDERKDCVHVVELGPNEKIVPKGECE